jgi:hypothetical protein
MMEAILLGVGIIFMVAGWHFVWMPTVLDSSRDKLFDLRDQTVRDYFVQKGIPLDNNIYQELRTLINGHLRHTESLTFFGFMSMLVWTAKNDEISSEIRERIERRFDSANVELKVLAEKTREQAARIMIEFMIESSILAMSLVLIGMIAMFIQLMWKYISSSFKATNGVSTFAFGRFAVALFVAISAIGGGSRVEARTARTTMEECALVSSVS